MTRQNRTEPITLTAGPLICWLDRTCGRVVGLRHEADGLPFIDGATGPGGLEVYDERERRWYTDLHTPATIESLEVEAEGVRFVKHFEEAPFSLRVRWLASEDGLHLGVEAALLDGEAPRSIRISFVLPATEALLAWAPSYPPPTPVAGSDVRYCYLADERGRARTGIPMLTLYRPGAGGLSLVMPFETPKVQLNLGPEPRDPRPWYGPERVPRITAGVEVDNVTPPEGRDLGADPVVRFTEKQVGLREGGTLPFDLWLFGHEPDWRCGLGAVTRRYAEYFEPHPDALKWAGPSIAANPELNTDEHIELARRFDVTHCWFHGHFEFHGEPLTDEAVGDPAYRWVCEPYPDRFRDLSVEQIRGQIHQLRQAGVGTFLYGFNMHCDETIIAKRSLEADVCRLEDGSVARSYHDQPVMFFHPDSPFGRQQLDQADRLMRTYPEIVGLALDNWNYAGIDFGHDDGVAMVADRPAANVNQSPQRFVTALAEKVHAAGRLLITNKGRTIESMRGIDLVLTEAQGAGTFATFAYINVFRTVNPTEYRAGEDAAYAEEVLQYELIWGGQMGTYERKADLAQARAYHPLILLLRNRRWVFEPDPLTLPDGVDGQIFHIDPRSPWNADALVVTLVRPGMSWRANQPRAAGPVKVRLADAGRFTSAEWLAVEASADGPRHLPLRRDGKELTVDIPPLGAAATLTLR
ncbi:MAG TPA: hypothetical protein VFJ30_10115 [Phycisphaerae bacterium]|nr:hypothetical protein [Phycisphaerae bacterium]